eukprot:4257565-Pleurochrysis_carterae.AAC.1
MGGGARAGSSRAGEPIPARKPQSRTVRVCLQDKPSRQAWAEYCKKGVQVREGMEPKQKKGGTVPKRERREARRRRLMQGCLPLTEPARTGCTADQMERVNSRNVIAWIVANERRAATHRKKAERRSAAMPDAGTPASNEPARTRSTAQQ